MAWPGPAPQAETLAKLNVGLKRNQVYELMQLLDVSDDNIFSGLDAYKQAIDSDANLVVIATPPGFKPPQFEYAVAKGKHVFMEKPVATDAPGVRRVLARAPGGLVGRGPALKGLPAQSALLVRSGCSLHHTSHVGGHHSGHALCSP